MFGDILERKQAFLDYKNKEFKKSKNWDFSNGVHGSGQKIENFPCFSSRHNWPRKCVSRHFLNRINGFLEGKKAFLNYKQRIEIF